ncbi:MAG: hypothetical protein QNK23_11395 [Crocinitomicaceae bacterium]|nr:hypothetical protein [Crocinitomicaceae bacterium]
MSSEKQTLKGGLSKRHWKFLVIENAIGPMTTNIFINAGITHLVFTSEMNTPVDIFGVQMDLLSTAFLLPFITVFLAYAVTGKSIRKEKLPKLPEGYNSKFDVLPQSIVVRAFLLGIVGIIFMAIPVILMLDWSDAQQINPKAYVYFKGIWAGLTAVLLSPIAGWWALVRYSK